MADARAILAAATRRRLALPERGVEIALLDWGGEGPLALCHHANGFCKGTLGLVADALRGRFRVVAMDARGHGDSSKPREPSAYRWHHFAEDALAVAEQLVAEGGEADVALGIGHSFGGTSLLGAAARRPGLFGRLLLVDPVTPPPPSSERSAEQAEQVQRLVDGARKRRPDWPSREEARAWLAERSLFADFLPEALDLYVEDGMRERPEGGVALQCPPEVEATIFGASGELDVFELARGVATPALFLRASRGAFPRAAYEAMASRMRAARVEEVDSGHLIPMEHPERVVEAALHFAAEAGEAAGAGAR